MINIDDFIKKINVKLTPELFYSVLHSCNMLYMVSSFYIEEKDFILNQSTEVDTFIYFTKPNDFIKCMYGVDYNLVYTYIRILDCDLDKLSKIINKFDKIKGFL